ncbi:hypothetical protein [Shinella sp. HZN7]|uniref:hypothetical protein n=1 Tax=Shinella sp. (strain HZN7) TaxID=879274 RepID=UPI0007DA8B12|nr:hypothetical protein [Shinella sp. HZN7]ANH02658.1 hypothetical protein shn_00460 [Shinella sp. HZN7]
MKTKNPAARAGANRVQNVKAFHSSVDNLDLTENTHKTQSEMLAAHSVMRRFGVSYFHALTVCQLSGLGGTAA